LKTERVGTFEFELGTDASIVCGAGSSANEKGGRWVTDADCAGGSDFEVAGDMVGDSSRRGRSTKIVTRA